MKRKDIESYIKDAFPEAEDEQVSELLEKIMADNGRDITSLKHERDSKDAEIERLKTIEKELDDYRKANMSAEEQMQAALQAAEEAKRDFAMKSNRLEIEQSFVEAGIAKEDYSDVLDSLVTADADASKASAAKLLELLTKQKEEVTKAVKKELFKDSSTGASQMMQSNGSVATPQSLDEQIRQAQESGDMVLAASLIRRSTEQSQIDTSNTN